MKIILQQEVPIVRVRISWFKESSENSVLVLHKTSSCILQLFTIEPYAKLMIRCHRTVWCWCWWLLCFLNNDSTWYSIMILWVVVLYKLIINVVIAIAWCLICFVDWKQRIVLDFACAEEAYHFATAIVSLYQSSVHYPCSELTDDKFLAPPSIVKLKSTGYHGPLWWATFDKLVLVWMFHFILLYL